MTVKGETITDLLLILKELNLYIPFLEVLRLTNVDLQNALFMSALARQPICALLKAEVLTLPLVKTQSPQALQELLQYGLTMIEILKLQGIDLKTFQAYDEGRRYGLYKAVSNQNGPNETSRPHFSL